MHVDRGVSPKGQANLVPLQAALIRAYGTHEGSPYVPLQMRNLCVELLGRHAINFAVDRSVSNRASDPEKVEKLLRGKFTRAFNAPISASADEIVISRRRVILPVRHQELHYEAFALHEQVAEIFGVNELPLNPIMAGVALGYFKHPPTEVQFPIQMTATDIDLTPVRFQ